MYSISHLLNFTHKVKFTSTYIAKIRPFLVGFEIGLKFRFYRVYSNNVKFAI